MPSKSTTPTTPFDTKGTPWPHGHPTETCQTCSGSGLSQAAIKRDFKSRRLPVENAKEIKELRQRVQCAKCEGRGRVIVLPVLHAQ